MSAERALWGGGEHEVRAEVRPPWPFRLPRAGGRDTIGRCRRGVLERLLHVGDEPAIVRVAQPGADRVLFGARAHSREVAEEAIARMRFAVGVDDDLRPFHERFRHDPLIGRAVRAQPHVRIRRRAQPFEALAWAICEQLIDGERACAIERGLVRTLGRRCEETGLRDAPSAAAVAGAAPALFESVDLSPKRAIVLLRAAREVSSGRVDLSAPDHERGWARLRKISGIGPWTVECLAFFGQGRMDQLPAGDLAFVKYVGRVKAGGDPRARADVDEVYEFFAPYGEWAGLAGAYALKSPHPGGTRWSTGALRAAA